MTPSTAWAGLEMLQALIAGDADRQRALHDRLSFSQCDPLWAEALIAYVRDLMPDGQPRPTPYTGYTALNDFVLTAPRPDMRMALLSDWGTGTDTAPRAAALLARHDQVNQNLMDSHARLSEAGRIDAWFWSHEHRVQVYAPYRGILAGRNIGYDAFPVEAVYGPEQPLQDLVDPPATLTQLDLDVVNGAYTHGFVLLDFAGGQIDASSWSLTRPDGPIYREQIGSSVIAEAVASGRSRRLFGEDSHGAVAQQRDVVTVTQPGDDDAGGLFGQHVDPMPDWPLIHHRMQVQPERVRQPVGGHHPGPRHQHLVDRAVQQLEACETQAFGDPAPAPVGPPSVVVRGNVQHVA